MVLVTPTFSGTVSPLSNITPFTYRDGLTFAEMLSDLKDYMVETMYPDFSAELERIIEEFNAGIKEADDAVVSTVEQFDEIHTAFTQAVAAQIAGINERTGPVNTQARTLTAPYSVVTDVQWPGTHPVNFELTQDDTGGYAATLSPDIDGSISTNLAPNGVTRFTLYKNQVTGRWFAKQDIASLPKFNVRNYGAQGIGVAGAVADTRAFVAAYNAAKAAGKGCIIVPDGDYVLNDEWNTTRPNVPRIDIVIKGNNSLTTFISSNFYGAGKALIKSHDPAGTTRSSPTSVYDVQLGTVDRNGPNPVMLDIYGHGESRLEGIRFGTTNNMEMSVAGVQNCRYRDIATNALSGRHYNYKPTNGILFSTTAGSNVMTSNVDAFTGADAGRMINIYGTSQSKHLISTFTDTKNVIISGTTPAITTVNSTAAWEPARITTVAGSNQVSANASVFTADDIGRVIYILGARNGSWGESLLRGKITGLVSGLTVTLDVTADISKTRTEFCTPLVEFYSPLGLNSNDRGNNDFRVDNLHLENYSGVGLVMNNTIFGHVNGKIHGEQTPIDTRASLAAMWLDDCSGDFDMDLDGQATGDHRIYLSNMNDTLTFKSLVTRRLNNARIFEAGTFTDPGGYVMVKNFTSYSAPASGDPYDLIQDPNTTPRVGYFGPVNMLGDTGEPRNYMGKGTYTTMAGDIVTKSPNGNRWKLAISDTGVVSTVAVTGI